MPQPQVTFGGLSRLRREASCRPVWRNLSSRGGSAYYNANATDYYRFKQRTSDPSDPAGITERVRVGVCQATAHGSTATWTSVMMGPFVSRGGYDWTTLYYPNIFFDVIEEVEAREAAWQAALDAEVLEMEMDDDDVAEHKDVPVRPRKRDWGVQSFFAAPVDEDGRPLSWPPLHVHHWEAIQQGSSGVLVTTGDGLCAGAGGRASAPASKSDSDSGGAEVECFGFDLGGAVSMHSPPVPMDMDINDVRPAGSAPLVWYFHAAVKVPRVVRASTPRVSLHSLVLRATSGATPPIPFAPLWAPTHADSYTYATGKMPRGGTLLRVRLHAHLLQDTLLHAATPEELGYTAAQGGTGRHRGTLGGGLAVEHDCFARPVRAAGFPSAAALRVRLLAMPQLVCSVEGRSVLVDGLRYARAGDVQCAAWRFAAGATFTLTTLMYATPTHQPIDVPPAYMDGYRQIHLFFDVFYASDDGQAHMTFDRYSASAEGLLDRDVHACVELAREAVVPAAPPTLPPPPPSLPAAHWQPPQPGDTQLGAAALCATGLAGLMLLCGALLRRRVAWRGSYQKVEVGADRTDK